MVGEGFMIHVISIHSDYYSGTVVMASESLQPCIDAVNKLEEFPYLGDRVVVSVYDNNKLIAKSETYGTREVWDDEMNDEIFPVTFEEIMSNMVNVDE